MGVDVPDLDDRTWEELVEAARKRIPVHGDEWTDHNVHDPGITILEVLASVVESDLYRLDRVTDEHVRKYLALLDASPDGPAPATARLCVEPPPALVGRSLPEGTRLDVETADGVELPFRTDRPVALTDASVAGVVTVTADGRTDHSTANRSEGMTYRGFGETAPEGAAMYLGFAGEPFVGGVLDLGFELDDAVLPERSGHGEEPPTFDPSVEVVWEYCTDYAGWHLDENWERARPRSDGTSAFYESGIVRFDRPADWEPGAAAILDHPRSLRWLRCRIVEGGHEVPPHLRLCYTNATTATHRRTVAGERLSRVDGDDRTTARPGQGFEFEHSPVLDATIEVGGEPWEPVDSLDASSPDAHHYVLDSAAGRLRFGDEIGGAVPEPGQHVVATSYDYGGGAVGNVSSSATWAVADERFESLDVSVRAVTGGRDAQTIDDAFGALERDRETPHRAVTAGDYEYVATHTPGLRFGRATAVVERAGGSAGGDDCEPHKRVRVVVVPHSTRDRPEPSDGFVEAVRRHVEAHRLLTDRVSVERPTYVGIGVRAEIEVASGYAASGRVDAVEAALRQFVDPLEGYDGDGWPFGRPVYRSELYEVVDGVEGVDCVGDVAVSATGERGVDAAGNVLLDGTALAYSTDHEVAVQRERDTCGGDP